MRWASRPEGSGRGTGRRRYTPAPAWRPAVLVGLVVAAASLGAGLRLAASQPSVAPADSAALHQAAARRQEAREDRKIALDERKEVDEWRRFEFDFYYRVGITLLFALLLIRAFPAISELGFTLPGGGGISLKRSPKLRAAPTSAAALALAEVPRELVEPLRSASGEAADRVISDVEQARAYVAAHIPVDGIYVCHRVVGRPQRGYRKIRVYLDADDPDYLRRVERVVYHLHPTFRSPDVEVTRRARGFELPISVWGEFMVRASVFVKDVPGPIELKRYLNF